MQEAHKGCGSRRGTDHVADRDPERPARRRWASHDKPARGARGTLRATQQRNALERGNPKGVTSGRTANPRSLATDSRGERGPEVGPVMIWDVAPAGYTCFQRPVNGKRAQGAERRYGSAGGESSEGENPMSVTGLKRLEGRGRRNAARGWETLKPHQNRDEATPG